ncbi:phage tail protein [Sphingomonas melonis]|uniref:phage tail protein n=1 Tax=Sphingomonas melonis TaxID=152682 RepID=UPI00037E98FC|nr:phage tail protein [Sphingomonas melonis]
MKKVDGLRALLLAAVPALKANPQNLSIYVDKGAIKAIGTRSLSFEIAYTLTVWIQAFSGDPDTVFVPILSWIARNQPDLLDRAEHQPFTFESELLDATTSDIAIEIQLTESVRVERLPSGKLRTTHIDDGRPSIGFEGMDAGVHPWRGLLDDIDAGA